MLVDRVFVFRQQLISKYSLLGRGIQFWSQLGIILFECGTYLRDSLLSNLAFSTRDPIDPDLSKECREHCQGRNSTSQDFKYLCVDEENNFGLDHDYCALHRLDAA